MPSKKIRPKYLNWKILLILACTLISFLVSLGPEDLAIFEFLGFKVNLAKIVSVDNKNIENNKNNESASSSGSSSGSEHDNTFPFSLPLPQNPLPNFQEAKKIAKQIFQDNRKTFYCGCTFDKHNKVDTDSCGYIIQQDKRRASRLEWEHIVPVSHLAAHFPCWKKSLCCNKKGECYRGRRCCREIDPEFSKMEADLHNIVPEIGELNAIRSNFRFGVLPHIDAGQFGVCEMKIDPETRRVEPRASIRGIIARTYLYMAAVYPFRLSDSQRQLFEAWNKEYPPDDWEIEWDNRIFFIQGNHNPYISEFKRESSSQISLHISEFEGEGSPHISLLSLHKYIEAI